MKGLFTAFSLYSAIPVPKTDWDNKAMRHALCFFPLIGIVIGILQYAWFLLCTKWQLTPALFAAVAAVLPIIITGGIHMDGFIDTCDAVFSHADTEKKLQILKDPHVGAFGTLFCAVQLLVMFGLWQQVYAKPALFLLILLGYTVSRALNALSIAAFPCAKTSGLVRTFSDHAAKRTVFFTCAFYLVVSAACIMWLSPRWGGTALLCAGLYFLLHKRFCMRNFGGNTGDLAGFLLCNTELIFLVIAAAGGVI